MHGPRTIAWWAQGTSQPCSLLQPVWQRCTGGGTSQPTARWYRQVYRRRYITANTQSRPAHCSWHMLRAPCRSLHAGTCPCSPPCTCRCCDRRPAAPSSARKWAPPCRSAGPDPSGTRPAQYRPPYTRLRTWCRLYHNALCAARVPHPVAGSLAGFCRCASAHKSYIALVILPRQDSRCSSIGQWCTEITPSWPSLHSGNVHAHPCSPAQANCDETRLSLITRSPPTT